MVLDTIVAANTESLINDQYETIALGAPKIKFVRVVNYISDQPGVTLPLSDPRPWFKPFDRDSKDVIRHLAPTAQAYLHIRECSRLGRSRS